mmetsp:Transcript_10804/g.19434  ORF Transcript_10804/g.19434 Transcript_10804/m.19434 type:complete len:81 (-) Transcript_10804:1172-1414(-)
MKHSYLNDLREAIKATAENPATPSIIIASLCSEYHGEDSSSSSVDDSISLTCGAREQNDTAFFMEVGDTPSSLGFDEPLG